MAHIFNEIKARQPKTKIPNPSGDASRANVLTPIIKPTVPTRPIAEKTPRPTLNAILPLETRRGFFVLKLS